VLPSAEPVVITLPPPGAPPARGGIPIVATLAPVALSLAIWAFTQSVLSLLFAGLGPLVALAGVFDTRRQRRRWRREERARLAGALERVGEQVAAAHEQERRRRMALCAPDGAALPRWAAERWVRSPAVGAPIPVRVGTGTVVSPVRLEGDGPDVGGEASDTRGGDLPAEVLAAWAGLRRDAAELADAPILADAAEGVGVVGPIPLAAAVARAVIVQIAAASPPDDVTIAAPSTEAWVSVLPHAVRQRDPGSARTGHATGGAEQALVRFDGVGCRLVVAWARDEASLPPGCSALVRVTPGDRIPALTRAEARERASVLADVAERHGLGAAAAALPDRVELRELVGADVRAVPGSLAAPIGRDARGPVVVDLVADGPHALVGGTTGSGKSELLVSWVLAMAHGRSPREVTFLLVDFKGGAAFAPLAGMPHVLGILSDLDARLTRRAIESLRAELLRRERLLAEAAARSIDELPTGRLARLVVVVDEFAAVVAGQPELHEVFTDLAARGRSLGLHLVLCTQRPAGVVRDGVLANVTLRIGLRMTDRADSIALLGDDDAATLPADARGRAVLRGDEGLRSFQVAIAGPGDIGHARRAPAAAVDAPSGTGMGTGTDAAPRPWLDPLPTVLPRSEIGAAAPDAIPFGLVDLPAEQRQPVAIHRPAAHGHLLVLGAAGAGRTTALAVLSAAPGATVLPDEPADAWHLLDLLLRDTDATVGRRLLIADDLDLLLGRVGLDDRHELTEQLARLLREGPARGVGIVASAQRIAGFLQPLAGLFGSRLLLRMPSREEHVLAGGTGAEFDAALPAGSGRWRGAVVQVAWPGTSGLPAPAPTPVPVVGPATGRPLAIVATRPGAVLASLRSAGHRAAMVGAGSEPFRGPEESVEPEVLVGDPDGWQTDWAALGRARRELPFVVIGCSATELRSVTRVRDVVPPLGPRPGECWLVEEGVVRRARWALHA
jgi:S-DNA-T family DNA segregation ATPase FtsK/SpoIIIE